MAGSDAGEKTEEATPKRRADARKKGTVAKSTDLTNALVVLGLILVLPTAISKMGEGFVQAFRVGLGPTPTDLSTGSISKAFYSALLPSLPGLALLVFTGMGIGVFANFAQVGLKVSPQAMIPSFGKLNPWEGLKRLFSVRSGLEGLKATGKSLLFGFLIYASIASNWSALTNLSHTSTGGAIGVVAGIVHSILVKVAMVWLVLAAVDYFIQRKQVDKSLRMSKQEVKQEMKEAEMNGEMKAARTRRMRRIIKGNMMEAVRRADVIITNPTHYAIAIKYEYGVDHAPIVVAKGVDFLAARIREAAQEAKVPLVPNPPLARALYKQCEIGDFVPRELFQAVAEILAYVYKTLKKVKVPA